LTEEDTMQIAFALYPAFTALDIIGPYNVLAYGPEVEAVFVAETADPVPADVGGLRIPPNLTFAQCPAPDVVVVPGGPGSRRISELGALSDWVRRAHETSRFTTSVCTGAFALASAGVLDGKKATTHWASMDRLAALSIDVVDERVVIDGKVVTGAGVSAGIDMALTLAGELWGDEVAQSIQLANEYEPQPPYDAGSVRTAPPHIADARRTLLSD
jgi:transcriptional regulator GlxA family with amidase domain